VAGPRATFGGNGDEIALQARFPDYFLLDVPLALVLTGRGEEPSYQGKSSSEWVQRLRSDNEKVRAEAAVALDESLGPGAEAAVPSLIEALKDKS
jgi:hypothetical protein